MTLGNQEPDNIGDLDPLVNIEMEDKLDDYRLFLHEIEAGLFARTFFDIPVNRCSLPKPNPLLSLLMSPTHCTLFDVHRIKLAKLGLETEEQQTVLVVFVRKAPFANME